MAETPSTLQQIILLVLFVLPGITYQFVRERMRGPVPGERDLAARVLRPLTASLAVGPWLVHMIKSSGRSWFATAAAQPRQAAAVSLVLFFVIPAAVALVVGMIERLLHPSRFDPVPTAWDGAFRERSTGFVRARLKSGTWVGGWYGRRSRASAYPNPPDLYLESAYMMGNDGSFGPRVQGTGGVYVSMTDVEVLEFVEVADIEPEIADGPGQGEGTNG